MISKTGERIIPENYESKEEYLIYLRHLFAYEFVEKKLPPKCQVLEVGFGEGYGVSKLSKSKKVKEIVGLDIDIGSVKHASSKYNSKKSRFKHYNGDKMPFENNSFDVVVSFQVIEHIKNEENYISEIYRVLKKHGIFVLTTPNRVYRLKPGQKPWNRFHVREYDSETLKKALRRKFSSVEIFGVKGNDEIQKIEIERVKRNLKLVALDPLNLRKLIPELLTPFVIKAFGTITSNKKGNRNFISRHKIEHYHTIDSELDTSLDLLGVCKKVIE